MILKCLFRNFFNLCGIYEVYEYKDSSLSKINWQKIRKFILTRTILIYWMEQTQMNLCKEGGKGRHEDLRMFNDFQISL